MSMLRPRQLEDCAELNSTCISEQTATPLVVTVQSYLIPGEAVMTWKGELKIGSTEDAPFRK